MKDAMVMAVGNSCKQLEQEGLHDLWGKPALTDVQVLLEVLVQVLEHQCQLSLCMHYVVQSVVVC